MTPGDTLVFYLGVPKGRYIAGEAVIAVVEKLSFAKTFTVERKYIGLLLRNGCRTLADEDVTLIRREIEG